MRHYLQAQGLLAFLKKDLCGRLWRAGYYPVVEGLRKALSQATSSEDREGEQTQSVLACSIAAPGMCGAEITLHVTFGLAAPGDGCACVDNSFLCCGWFVLLFACQHCRTPICVS